MNGAFALVLATLGLLAALLAPGRTVAAPLATVTQLAAGTSHTCARLIDGSVRCWGSNQAGQIGDGSLREALTATPVAAIEDVVAVAAGGAHSCALTATGTVKCWGANDSGQLGAAGAAGSRLPVDVSGLGASTAIVAGRNHSCALTAAGGVRCWGANDRGQLGNGSFASAFAPVDVQGLASGVVEIAAGNAFTCVRTVAGAVKCWGANNAGQLGNGSLADSATPVDVTGLASGVAAIALGYDHACATTASIVKCWGDNQAAQLANGQKGTVEWTPVDATLMPPSTAALALGRSYTCALVAQVAKCIGAPVLGNGTMLGYDYFTNVEQLGQPVTAIAAGTGHACALLADGTVKCWGDNSSGQAGNGTTWRERTPVVLASLGNDASRLRGSDSHACRVNVGGGVNCWGSNVFGELGTNSYAQWLTPAVLPDLMSGAAEVSLGSEHSCALLLTGGVKCWGWNHYGQLGNTSFLSSTRPTDVVNLASGVMEIASIGFRNCALMLDRTMKCWGANYSGELGIGIIVDTQPIPTNVVGLDAPVLQMALGGTHGCALTVDGRVKCWGVNTSHQLGRPDPVNTYTALDVIGLPPNVSAIAAGIDHTCALVAGGVKCWGANYNGELGIGTIGGSTPTPTDVVGATSGVAAIASGGWTTCLLTVGGEVKCWGYDNDVYLAAGTGVNSPVPIVIPLGPAVALRLASSHLCAIRADGSAVCQGSNRSGVFANGKAAFYAYPVQVLAAGCAGFDDVDTSSPFCANLQWTRNRGIAQGCTATTYCGDAVVTRTAMAAFMARMAVPYTAPPALTQQVSGALDPDAAPIVCVVDMDVVGYGRRAHVDAVLTARSLASATANVSTVVSFDGGTSWSAVSNRALSAPVNRWTNHRAMADVDVAAGTPVRIGLRVDRGAPPGTGVIDDSACVLRVRSASRDGTSAPFDAMQ